jgi:2'-5' RNA ligase
MDFQFPLPSVFVAIPLEGMAKFQFQACQQKLKPFESFLRLQKSDTPHLTLRFWPSVMKIEYDQLLKECAHVAEQSSAFDLPIIGADTFGRRGEDRTLYLQVAFSPELATLKKKCPWPNPPDEPFTPHITLARISHPQRFRVHKKKVLKALEDIDFAMHVDRLALYAKVGGANQTLLEEFVLRD